MSSSALSASSSALSASFHALTVGPSVLTDEWDKWTTAISLSDDASTVEVDLGRAQFNHLFATCPIVQYTRNSAVVAVYVRQTAIPAGFDAYALFTHTWASASNKLLTDFNLYDDLAAAGTAGDSEKWTWCNYDDEGIGFPRDCGRTGEVASRWFSKPGGQHNPPDISSGASFEIYSGLECELYTGPPECYRPMATSSICLHQSYSDSLHQSNSDSLYQSYSDFTCSDFDLKSESVGHTYLTCKEFCDSQTTCISFTRPSRVGCHASSSCTQTTNAEPLMPGSQTGSAWSASLYVKDTTQNRQATTPAECAIACATSRHGTGFEHEIIAAGAGTTVSQTCKCCDSMAAVDQTDAALSGVIPISTNRIWEYVSCDCPSPSPSEGCLHTYPRNCFEQVTAASTCAVMPASSASQSSSLPECAAACAQLPRAEGFQQKEDSQQHQCECCRTIGTAAGDSATAAITTWKFVTCTATGTSATEMYTTGSEADCEFCVDSYYRNAQGESCADLRSSAQADAGIGSAAAGQLAADVVIEQGEGYLPVDDTVPDATTTSDAEAAGVEIGVQSGACSQIRCSPSCDGNADGSAGGSADDNPGSGAGAALPLAHVPVHCLRVHVH